MQGAAHGKDHRHGKGKGKGHPPDAKMRAMIAALRGQAPQAPMMQEGPPPMPQGGPPQMPMMPGMMR